MPCPPIPPKRALLSEGGVWEGLDWILGKISLLKEWSYTGIGCPEKWWSHHPWRCSKNV